MGNKQASIDILAELGYLSSCLMMITLLGCIKQARWPTDGPLSILPGVDVSEEKKRIEDGTLPPASLVDLPTLPPPALEGIIRLLVPYAHQSSVSVTRFSFTTLIYHPMYFNLSPTKRPPVTPQSDSNII